MENKKYHSISKILEFTKPLSDKIFLSNWKNKVGIDEAERISKASLERGKLYDKYVSDYYNGIEIPNKQLKNYLSEFEILSIEQYVYSDLYNYCGRYDCIFKKNDILYINDFKGSNKKKKKEWLKDYPLQLSAYIKAYNEYNKNINYGMITIITDNEIQNFIYNENEINNYFDEFMNRYNKYLEIINK